MKKAPLLLAANWKMNLGPKAAAAFFKEFLAAYSVRHDRQVLFFPPSLSIDAIKNLTGGRPDISLGVQNIYWEESGAFTGELSASMVKETVAQYVLVGHSERRHIFGETNEECAKKCAAAEKESLTPILCVGETLEQRESGETERVVLDQLKSGLELLEDPASTVKAIAYEPVWAIGTGKTATAEDAEAIHGSIREALRGTIGESAAEISILYGGSVKPDNARQLLDQPNVDGLLVGGASLDPNSWLSICNA